MEGAIIYVLNVRRRFLEIPKYFLKRNKMTDKIKEKLLKEIESIKEWANSKPQEPVEIYEDYNLLKAKLKQHEETKEWFIKLINKFDFGKYLEPVEEINDEDNVYYGINMDSLLKELKRKLNSAKSGEAKK